MNKPEFHLVSFSGGKDSTAMLLGMIERGMPIDCILFCDTGLEFPEMYKHIDRVEKYIGRPITRIKSPLSYEEWMFEFDVKRTPKSKILQMHGPDCKGYGWPGPRMRWCTKRLKDFPREEFLKDLREQYTIKEYVGIAADEGYRLQRKTNQQGNHVHPLVDWNMTEADCLAYCYDKGFDWDGLYDHFKRVSCWCCPLQSLPELRMLHKHHPQLWAQLKNWDQRTWRNFRADYSVEKLEVRFAFEEECIANGQLITGKAFHTALRDRLNRAPGNDGVDSITMHK